MSQSADNDNFKLPALNPLIRLYMGTPNADGTPRWTIHQTASNKYYQLGWAEFECLARLHQCQDAVQLKQKVESETTLKIEIKDIEYLVIFLRSNGLVVATDQKFLKDAQEKAAKGKSLWEQALHNYLYFTVPLFKPEVFLKRTLPFVEKFYTGKAAWVFISIFILGLILTLQRPDEFFHTFTQLFSIEGAILTFFVFTAIKILHEFAHAFTAVRNGVPVPHMGLAFIVLCPVLYTETTGAWQLSSRTKRTQIALAGVTVELALAGVFLILWHVFPAGMARSLCFSVIAVSLIGSLLVNLNPLMRFDGYYVLSDLIGIENLHQKSIAFARRKIRSVFFGLYDPPPFHFSMSREKFLTIFGFVVLIYRFFLFVGIAVMVYHVFFKPLGPFLMLVELGVFIALPAYMELRIWWQRRFEIWAQRRARISLAVFAICAALFILPVNFSVNLPAVLHAEHYRAIYPPAPSLVEALLVQEGQVVQEGDILLQQSSFAIENEWKKTKEKLAALEILKQREQTDAKIYHERGGRLDQQIDLANKEFTAADYKKKQLTLRAPFTGIVRDLSPEIRTGRSLSQQDLLFRLVDPIAQTVTGYIRESDLSRIRSGAKARFRPAYALWASVPLEVESIEAVNAQAIVWPELASVYGGSLPSAKQQEGPISPLEPIYTVRFKVLKNTIENQSFITKGNVVVQASPSSGLMVFVRNMLSLFTRESSFN